MRLSPRSLVLMLVGAVLFIATPEISAQTARVAGTVVDPDGQPVPGVTVTVTSPDSEKFELVRTTNKKGAVTLSFSNVEMRYDLRLEKDGYRPKTEPLPIPIGGTAKARWVLVPSGTVVADDGDAGVTGGGGGVAVRTYNEGAEAQRLGDLDLAEEKYRQAAEADPRLAAPHTALATVALIRENWDMAAAEAEAALAIDPGDVRALQIRFDAYRHGGNEEKADEAAQALREVGNLDEAAARIFNEGVDAYSAGDVATAQSKFQQVIQLSPDMVPPYVALAQISLAQGSASEALAMARSALEREPDNSRALMIALDGARLAGDVESATESLDRLVELEPQWVTTTLFEHAGRLFNNGELEAAIFELRAVVKADPELARAHYLLGMALFNSGRSEEGRAHLQRFVDLAPDDPDVEIAQGLLSYQQ